MSDSSSPAKSTGDVTLVVRQKSDGLGSQALQQEDMFKELYFTDNNKEGKALEPPYLPEVLRHNVQENNALQPCIEAMEVNIDGTGHVVELREPEADGEAQDEQAIAIQHGIFGECYPGLSWLHERRTMRRDQEEVGYALMEVVRNAADEILFLRRMDPDISRLLRYDEPITVSKTLNRNGREISVRTLVRERRYMQKIGDKVIYFKEFGATRDLNKETGQWADSGRLPATQRATEVILFGNKKHPGSAYYVPRWISQSPSVVGSRAAEELNLEFFESGGIPPVLISIMGGSLTPESKETLNKILSGKAKQKLAAAVLEVFSTDGSLEKAGTANLSVDSFGADAVKDSMFEGYDDKCESRIRRAFRLPPLFVGKADDYSFATAFASYTVAEEQVFGPERSEFDAILNVTLMRDPSLGGGKYVFRSRPLTVNDIDSRLKVLELAKREGAITNEHLIDKLNESSNLNLTWSGEESPANQLAAVLAGLNPEDLLSADPVPGTGGSDDELLQKAEVDTVQLIDHCRMISRALTRKASDTEAATALEWYKKQSKRVQLIAKVLVAKDLLLEGESREVLDFLDSEVEHLHG